MVRMKGLEPHSWRAQRYRDLTTTPRLYCPQRGAYLR